MIWEATIILCSTYCCFTHASSKQHNVSVGRLHTLILGPPLTTAPCLFASTSRVVIQSLNGSKVNIKCAQRFSLRAKRQNRISNFIFFSPIRTLRSAELIAVSWNDTTKVDESGQNRAAQERETKKRARDPPIMCDVRQCVYARSHTCFLCHFNKKRMQGSSLIRR